ISCGRTSAYGQTNDYSGAGEDKIHTHIVNYCDNNGLMSNKTLYHYQIVATCSTCTPATTQTADATFTTLTAAAIVTPSISIAGDSECAANSYVYKQIPASPTLDANSSALRDFYVLNVRQFFYNSIVYDIGGNAPVIYLVDDNTPTVAMATDSVDDGGGLL